ncbi:hypothetical protein ACRB68_21910 [Actinomadura sp. RB68]|uniref:XRE family transcriptional regulator n=1 Tax=Actinomadura macrotermitis TaxID=2585200 RepID=A0A7K0BSI0_9ACTN|nr:hypothetical protein [Actinomadura macrotermitis]
MFEVDLDDLFGSALDGQDADVDRQRRHLLSCLSALGVEGAVRMEPLEPIREALVSVLPGDPHARIVQDWEEIAFEHGHAFLTTAPSLLLPDLAADLVALQDVMQRARDDEQRRRLCGPAGKLSALVAMTVATLGQPRQARDWWRAARHTADASGDRDLRVWVRGYEAMNALYNGRPLAAVLRLADDAIAIAGGASGAAVLEAMASRAQTLALLGHAEDAEKTIAAMHMRFEGLPGASPDERLSTSAWPKTALQHTTAFTFTHCGPAARAERAQADALALYPPGMRRQRAQIALLQAVTQVRRGDIDTAVDIAGRAVSSLDPGQRTTTIRRGARMVLDAVPEVELSRPAVRDYRAALALPSASGAGAKE